MMQQQPNIVLVMADQMTAFALSAYGNTVSKTPNLDSLAESATIFENAYCNYPLCAPSRFALMSGRLPSRIAAYDNASEFPASIPTVAHYLRNAGYYTFLSGKMHFVGPDQLHGFEDRLTAEIYPSDFSWTPPATYDEFVDPEFAGGDVAAGVSSVETITDVGPRARSMQMDYDDEVVHRACQHIYDRARSGDSRPLFATVSFTQPHDPYVSKKEFWDLYADTEIDLPRVPPIPLEEMDPHSRSLFFHYSLNKVPISDEVCRRARHGYYAMISDVDQKFGQLRNTIEECGMTENTVILFTSDHGDMMGERGLWFKKNLFEPAVRVPLMLSIPGGDYPGKIDAPVSLVDVLPTFTEIAGVPKSALTTEVDGTSLLQVCEKQETVSPVCVEHLEGSTRAPRVMLRKGNLKLVYSLEYPAQLYDLSTDPLEQNNLAGDPDRKEELSRLCSDIDSVWDLETLKQSVIENQRTRQLLHASLSTGKITAWDSHPNPHITSSQWVRQGDAFPAVEQRGYLYYPDEDAG